MNSLSHITLVSVVVAVLSISCDQLAIRFEGLPTPIGTQDEVRFDPRIVGVWRSADSDDPGELKITSPNLQTYDVEMTDEDGIQRGRAVAVEISGIRLLNLQVEGVEGYLPIFYRLDAPNRLEFLAFTTDEDVPEVEVEQFIRQHIHDSRFFEEVGCFERVSLW
jgi:hypothetical protein